jgi:hypothetical protein
MVLGHPSCSALDPLAEDDCGLFAGWCPSSRCVRAPCSHSLFYADRLACAGALRVPGFILIAHGSNSRVVYRHDDGCSACARVGTRDETNTGTRDQTRVCHGPDARDAVFCDLAVGGAVACFANEATQPPTFVAQFDVRSSISSRWQAMSVDSPGSSHRENGSLLYCSPLGHILFLLRDLVVTLHRSRAHTSEVCCEATSCDSRSPLQDLSAPSATLSVHGRRSGMESVIYCLF